MVGVCFIAAVFYLYFQLFLPKFDIVFGNNITKDHLHFIMKQLSCEFLFIYGVT